MTIIHGECGIINGNNNHSNTIYCDEVNKYISETLLLAVEGDQTHEWQQIIDNSLSVNIDSNNTFTDTSIIYQLSQISKLTEISLEEAVPCLLPNTESISDTSEWKFDEIEVKKNLW